MMQDHREPVREDEMADFTRRTMLAAAAGTVAAAVPPVGTQAPGFYRYKLGDVEVTVVTDGASTIPLPDKYVVNAAKSEVGAQLAAAYLDSEKITIPYSPIVLNTGGRLVAIDTGNGEAAFASSKGASGQYQTNLKASGIDRATIDTVVISHFHGDHVNGLLAADGKPAFANAEILVPRAEWAFWMDDGEMSRAAPGRMQDGFKNVRRVFDALGRKVTPYDWDKEIVPGLTAKGTPGHTPGHTSFVVASGSKSLFVQSDVTNVPVLFARRPGWHVMFDQDAAMAEATRRKTYDMVAAERMLLQGYHYPFPAVGHLEKTADGYREIPVPWSPVV
jgi:glyoxylase-like metal-dependent hydrolase (beta-lactamase superfamily II)